MTTSKGFEDSTIQSLSLKITKFFRDNPEIIVIALSHSSTILRTSMTQSSSESRIIEYSAILIYSTNE